MRVTPRRILAALGLALVVALAVLWLFPSDDYLLLPDPAHPVGPKVFVANSKRDNDGGGIYFVDVILRRAKLFESIFPSIHSGASLVPARAINPPGVNDQARREEDLREMVRSQSIAAAVALRAAGYKVVARPIGVLVSQVDPSGPAAGALEPTDLIVAVDGKKVRTPNALRRIMETHRPGDRVRFTFHRGKTIRQATLKTVADPSDPKRAIVGILIDQAADIKLPVKVRINLGDVGGPSAGLAFALDIVEELRGNVDGGLKVAATGEIELDGDILPIGGVKQKVIGAKRSGADVFLVPAGENAAEARRHAGDLPIIPVENFRQALRALATFERNQ